MDITVRTIDEYNLTTEMNCIIDAVESGIDVKGFAYAGGGKSTLLRAIEKFHKNKIGIYLCYNKTLEREARTLFVGTNVHIYTSHAYALATFDTEIKKGFLRKVSYKPDQKMILEFAKFDLDNSLFDALSIEKNWNILLDICYLFIQTASTEISEIHLTETAKKLITTKINNKSLKTTQNKNAANYLINHSRLLLKSMFDTNNECFCTHDTYIKYWQLSKPVIDDYDYIMFDEAQDGSPVLLNIIFSQKCQKIFVGDRHQSIYLFKTGINAMDMIPCKAFPLSSSFRYGQKIADLATNILRHYDSSIEIKGVGFDTEIIKGSDYVDADNLLYISNTNIHLLEILIDCHKAKVPAVFVTNKASTTLSKVESISSIANGGEGIGNVKKYDTIDKLSHELRDPESKKIIEWFKDDREKFNALIEALRWTLKIVPGSAAIKLGTAHSCKGLEEEVVMLADDFVSVIDAFGSGKPLKEDELNLIYVAVTRAKKKLILSDLLHEALTKKFAFTLHKHKPAKCMTDNIVPASYKPNKSGINVQKEQTTQTPEQPPSETNVPTQENIAPEQQPKKKNRTPRKAQKLAVKQPPQQQMPPSLVCEDVVPEREMKIVVGQSKEDGTDLLWCPTNTDLYLNLNLAVVGTMGTGKTQTVKSIITQLHRQKELNTDGESLGILIFDYKSDYTDADFVNATGATVLEARNLPINPFVLPKKDRLAIVNTAKVFITTVSKIYRLGVKQEQALRNYIIAAYDSKNIDKDNLDSYDNIPPTMRDVIAAYHQGKVAQDSLTSALSELHDFEVFEPKGSKCKTLYDLLDDNIVVVKLGGVDSNLQNLIVAVLLDQFYIQMQKAPKPRPNGKHRALKKLVLVDEADNIMRHDFCSLRKIMKEGREFGVGCLLSTQGLDHFQTAENNYSDFISVWISHRLKNAKSKDVEQLLNCAKQDVESNLKFIMDLDQHHALFIDSKNKITHQHIHDILEVD